MPGRAPLPAPPRALYVHVPFCLSVCPYCDFVVHAGSAARGPRSLVAPFVDALLNEIRLRAAVAEATFGTRRRRLKSVYVGGGTPSLLAAADVARVLDAVDAGFGLAADAEITLEVNPGPADRGDVAAFGAAGVNRLSVGAQSMVAAELRALGRRHAAADVADTVRLARRAGVRSVSLDLLYDVPGQTMRSWGRTLDAVLELEPDHVSAYALSLDDPDAEGLTGPLGDHLSPSTGARRWRARARGAQDPDRAADMYLEADQRFAAAGLRWYELSSWSRAGHESRHNLVYWRAAAYDAVGPGAHAFDGALTRRWNAASLAGYVAALTPSDGGALRLPPGDSDMMKTSTAAAEQTILRLRLRQGVPAGRVPAAVASWGRREGLLARLGGRLALTPRGRLLANEVFLRLLPRGDRLAA